MKSTVGRLFGFFASLVFIALLAAPAQAERGENENEGHHDKRPVSHSAPEIDPAGLAAIGALLVGGSLLLKARRNRSKV